MSARWLCFRSIPAPITVLCIPGLLFSVQLTVPALNTRRRCTKCRSESGPRTAIVSRILRIHPVLCFLQSLLCGPSLPVGSVAPLLESLPDQTLWGFSLHLLCATRRGQYDRSIEELLDRWPQAIIAYANHHLQDQYMVCICVKSVSPQWTLVALFFLAVLKVCGRPAGHVCCFECCHSASYAGVPAYR